MQDRLLIVYMHVLSPLTIERKHPSSVSIAQLPAHPQQQHEPPWLFSFDTGISAFTDRYPLGSITLPIFPMLALL